MRVLDHKRNAEGRFVPVNPQPVARPFVPLPPTLGVNPAFAVTPVSSC